MAAHFKQTAQTYPMVLGQGGLVLYEKCTSTDETTLLNRLSKPKKAKPSQAKPPAAEKEVKGEEGTSGYEATSTSSPSPQPGSQREQDWKSTWRSKGKSLPEPSPLPPVASAPSSTSQASLKYGVKFKMTPSKEQEELASYVQREKGLMTHAYSWGGRLHSSGPSEMSGVSRQSFSLGTKKPPLRL
jgi:hypothetical protein